MAVIHPILDLLKTAEAHLECQEQFLFFPSLADLVPKLLPNV